MTTHGRIVENRIVDASLANPESGARLVALLRELVEVRNQDDVIVEFQKSRSFPNACVPVATAVGHYRRRRVRIQASSPGDRDLDGRQLTVFEPRIFTPADGGSNEPLLEAVWQFDHDDAGPLLQRLIEELTVRVACRPGVLRALEWAIYEVMDNALSHSKRRHGYLMADVHDHGRYVAIAIGDDGQGIVAALRPALGADLYDFDVLERATHEGVTGVIGSQRRGNGLWGLRNITQGNEGRLTITSGGEGLAVHDRALRRITCERVSARWPGTFVDFQLRTSEPVDLPKALGGHDPVNLRMEDLTDDDGVVRIQVNEIVSNIGMRGSGERLRNYVLNLLSEGAERVVLDFTRTGMASSSFADEVGGGLAQALGVETFEQRVAFANLGADEASLFQRGIEGRVRP